MLRELVVQGALPPVSERLPENPLVVTPVESVGRYGGTWRRLAISRYDSLMGSRLGYEPLVRWDRSGKKIVPGLAERWEILEEGRRYVFFLRKGLKWSDGHAFTSADFLFWYEDQILNEDLNPVFPTFLTPSGGRFSVQAPAPHIVEFLFDRSNGIFLETLGFRGHNIYIPKHYLKQFHVRYRAEAELLAEAAKDGLDLWHRLFLLKADLHDNPELPTMRPWRIEVPPPSSRLVAARNPYYWKVDPAGNQLPYIDRIAFTIMQNGEVLNFKAMTGDVDMQARYIDSSKYTLFMKNRLKNGVRQHHVYADTTPTSTCIYVNQHSKNEVLRPILQDRRFRIALSLAINREELIELVYSGLATPSNAIASASDPFYLPAFRDKFIAFDPARANRLLDEVGLRRARGGMRRMPSGEPFRQILNCYPSETGVGSELWQLVTEYWREVGLDFIVKTDARMLSSMRVRNGNSDFWAYAIAGMHWLIDPGWYVPVRDGAYFAPLYGRYLAREGRAGVKPSPEFQNLVDLYRELASTWGDEQRKLALGQQILSQWAEECYIIGIVQEKALTIVSDRFRNFPGSMIHCYRLMAPGYLDPEQFYLAE